MLDTIRAILPEGGSHKGTSSCQNRSCKKSTREGKPFCSGHVEDAPYVRAILDILKNSAKEAATLRKGKGRINKQGYFYRETLLLLRSRDFTAKGLSRRLDLSHKAAERLIWLMAKDKLVKAGETSRGEKTISGLSPRDLAPPPKHRN